MSAYMTQKIVLVFSYDYVLEFSKEGDKPVISQWIPRRKWKYKITLRIKIADEKGFYALHAKQQIFIFVFF